MFRRRTSTGRSDCANNGALWRHESYDSLHRYGQSAMLEAISKTWPLRAANRTPQEIGMLVAAVQRSLFGSDQRKLGVRMWIE